MNKVEHGTLNVQSYSNRMASQWNGPSLLNVNSLFIFHIKQFQLHLSVGMYAMLWHAMPVVCCTFRLVHSGRGPTTPLHYTPLPYTDSNRNHTFNSGCCVSSVQSINQLISQSNLLWRHIKINEWVWMRCVCMCFVQFGLISNKILHTIIHVCRSMSHFQSLWHLFEHYVCQLK